MTGTRPIGFAGSKKLALEVLKEMGPLGSRRLGFQVQKRRSPTKKWFSSYSCYLTGMSIGESLEKDGLVIRTEVDGVELWQVKP